MSQAATARERHCPLCQADLEPAAARCWLCRAPLRPEEGYGELPTRLRPPAPDVNPIWTVLGFFGLALLVGTTLIGLFNEAPGLAIGLVIPLTPALIRMAVLVKKARASGQPVTGGQSFVYFLSSLGVVVGVGVAASVAFGVTCFSVCLGLVTASPHRFDDSLAAVAIGSGVVVGLILATLLFWLAWRPRKS